MVEQKLTAAHGTTIAGYKVDKEEVEKDIVKDDSYKKNKLDILTAQRTKAEYDSTLVNEKTEAMKQQLIDQRRIKALEQLSDTYGTIGASSNTVSTEMWTIYYALVKLLADGNIPTATDIAIPASTSVTKVS
jgi:hypothetical protein